MENTFYRPAVVDIKTYEKIVEKLRKDLKSLVSGQASEGEIIEYVKKQLSKVNLCRKIMKWYSGVWAIQEICLLMEESIFSILRHILWCLL